MNKSTYEEKNIFHLTAGHPSSRKVKKGTQGRILEAGDDAEVMEECCLLAYSSWLHQSDFL